MLPDFPHSKDQIRNRIMLAIDHAMRVKAPLLAGMKTLVQHEGKIHAYDRVRAKPVIEGYHELAIPVTLDLTEVPDLVGAKLVAKIDEIAEHKAQREMDLFHQKHWQISEEVGNTLNANGDQLNGDLLLELIEKADMQFGPDGQPLNKFVAGPALAAPLQKLLDDPSFRARYDDLVEGKRNVWRDRESDRKLVD
jgi:hypothetical protein